MIDLVVWQDIKIWPPGMKDVFSMVPIVWELTEKGVCQFVPAKEYLSAGSLYPLKDLRERIYRETKSYCESKYLDPDLAKDTYRKAGNRIQAHYATLEFIYGKPERVVQDKYAFSTCTYEQAGQGLEREDYLSGAVTPVWGSDSERDKPSASYSCTTTTAVSIAATETLAQGTRKQRFYQNSTTHFWGKKHGLSPNLSKNGKRPHILSESEVSEMLVDLKRAPTPNR